MPATGVDGRCDVEPPGRVIPSVPGITGFAAILTVATPLAVATEIWFVVPVTEVIPGCESVTNVMLLVPIAMGCAEFCIQEVVPLTVPLATTTTLPGLIK